MVVQAQSEESFNRLLNSSPTTIVDFTASWCPPCRSIKPVFEDLARNHTDIQFIKVDVDELPDLAAKSNIRSMPTFIVYKNGVMTNDVLQGAIPDALYQLVRKHSSVKPIQSSQDHKRSNPNVNKRHNKLKKCVIL